MTTPAIKELDGLITFYQDQRAHSARSAKQWRASIGHNIGVEQTHALKVAEQHERTAAYAAAAAAAAAIISTLSAKLAVHQGVAT